MDDKISRAVEAQERYCEENELPCYAPSNGRCPNCQRNIYLDGYGIRHASRNLITCCPHCHYSFVE